MKSNPNSEFGELIEKCSQRATPKQRATVRRKLKKTAYSLGSNPEEVLKHLLESAENTKINSNGSDTGDIAPSPAASTEPEIEQKRGLFQQLLSKLGFS